MEITAVPCHPGLRHVYAGRREHLSARGVDVSGIDALLAFLDRQPSSQPGSLSVFSVATPDERLYRRLERMILRSRRTHLIGFVDNTAQSLVGMVCVPKDLPPLRKRPLR